MDKQIEPLEAKWTEQPEEMLEKKVEDEALDWNKQSFYELATRIENDLFVIKICILFFAILTVIGITWMLILIFS